MIRLSNSIKRLKTAHRVFLSAVTVYAGMLICLPVVVYVAHAQQADRIQRLLDQKDDIERRIRELESLNLDHRLTVIETLLRDQENNGRWMLLSSGGVGLLLAEAVFRTTKKRLRGEE